MEHGGWLCPLLNATWSTISRCPRQQEQPPPTGCRISSLVVHREKSVRKVFQLSWSFWRPLQVANMALEKESVSDEFGLRDLQVVQLLLLLLMFQNWVAFLHISSLDQDKISLCNFHLVTSPRRRSPSLDYRRSSHTELQQQTEKKEFTSVLFKRIPGRIKADKLCGVPCLSLQLLCFL